MGLISRVSSRTYRLKKIMSDTLSISPTTASKNSLRSSLLFGNLDNLRNKQGLNDDELDRLLNGNPSKTVKSDSGNDDILQKWRQKNRKNVIENGSPATKFWLGKNRENLKEMQYMQETNLQNKQIDNIISQFEKNLGSKNEKVKNKELEEERNQIKIV